jgi:probable rRNA maturation factor
VGFKKKVRPAIAMAHENDQSDALPEPDSSADALTKAREIDTADGNIIELVSATSVWQDEVVNDFVNFASPALDHIQDFFDLPALCVSVLLDDDARIRQLNRDFRDQDKPTNVLSFPAIDDELGGGEDQDDDDVLELGDIAIAYETLAGEASAAGIGFNDHLSHLFVHGVMHLLGYDHEDPSEAAEMEALEVAILAHFSIADPYAGSDPITGEDGAG